MNHTRCLLPTRNSSFQPQLMKQNSDLWIVNVQHRNTWIFNTLIFSGPPKFHNRPSRGNILFACECTSECVCGCVCVWALIRAVATACHVLNVNPNPQTFSASIFKQSYQYFFGLASRNSRQNWGLKHSFFRKDGHGRYLTEGLAVRGWFVAWGHGLLSRFILYVAYSTLYLQIYVTIFHVVMSTHNHILALFSIHDHACWIHYSISCTYVSSRYFDGYPLKRSLSRFQSFVPGKTSHLRLVRHNKAAFLLAKGTSSRTTPRVDLDNFFWHFVTLHLVTFFLAFCDMYDAMLMMTRYQWWRDFVNVGTTLTSVCGCFLTGIKSADLPRKSEKVTNKYQREDVQQWQNRRINKLNIDIWIRDPPGQERHQLYHLLQFGIFQFYVHLIFFIFFQLLHISAIMLSFSLSCIAWALLAIANGTQN